MGLYKREYGQQIKERYHPILSICAVRSAILHPVLDSLSSRKVLRWGDGWGPKAHDPQGEVNGPGLFQLDMEDANG